MEDRRRRNVAFVKLAKERLRYQENSEEVKVGITELQEQLEVLVQTGISNWLSRRGMKGAKRCLKYFGKKKNYVLPAGQGGMRSGKVW